MPIAQPSLALLLVRLIPSCASSLAAKRKILEVDDVAMVGMGRAVVDLFAADVGEDALGVARVLGDQLVHLGDRARDALGVGVVEGEAHAEDVAADEALAGVGFERLRVVVAAGVEQEGRDDAAPRGRRASRGPGSSPLCDVDDADHDRRLARPLAAPDRRCRSCRRPGGSGAARWRACRPGGWCWWRSGRSSRLGAAGRRRGGRSGRRGRRCRARPACSVFSQSR